MSVLKKRAIQFVELPSPQQNDGRECGTETRLRCWKRGLSAMVVEVLGKQKCEVARQRSAEGREGWGGFLKRRNRSHGRRTEAVGHGVGHMDGNERVRPSTSVF